MRRDAGDLERWIEEHPHLAWVYTIGAAVMICEVAAIIDQLIRLGARRP